MSSRYPTTVGFSLETLARRGGLEGPNKDGWGVAYFEGNDVFLLRETVLHNTQPFQRELGGRAHVFIHNGDLVGVRDACHLESRRFRPIGDTDSEFA